MEKKNIAATFIGIPSGILFALGMVLIMETEWNLFWVGLVLGIIGLLGLILIIPVYRKLGNYPALKLKRLLVISILVGLIGLIMLGVGMSIIMGVEEPTSIQILIGLIVGIVGLLILAFNPVIYGLIEERKNKNEFNQNQVNC